MLFKLKNKNQEFITSLTTILLFRHQLLLFAFQSVTCMLLCPLKVRLKTSLFFKRAAG